MAQIKQKKRVATNSVNKPISKLKKEIISKIEFELKRANGMLSNDKFISNASKELVNTEKEKVLFYEKSLEMIK